MIIDPYCTFGEKGQCNLKISCYECHENTFKKLEAQRQELMKENAKLRRRYGNLFSFLGELVESKLSTECIEGFFDTIGTCDSYDLSNVSCDTELYPMDEVIEEPRITLFSSNGQISFDEDGCDPKIPEDQEESYLNDIAQIDVAEWKYMYPGEDPLCCEHDILDFAMWDTPGRYDPAEAGWRDDFRSMRAGGEMILGG